MISMQLIFNIVLSALTVYFVTLLYVRIVGLRSFSKMSSLDFAMTIAVGSMLASTVLPSKANLLEGLIAIAALFMIQWFNSELRKRAKSYREVLENSPIIIMRDGVVLNESLLKVQMTESDLMAKLREANVLSLKDVKYAVFETTGDVSIIHGDKQVDEMIMLGAKEIK